MLQISDEALYVSEAQSDLDRHNAVNLCTPFHDVTMKYLRIKASRISVSKFVYLFYEQNV